MRGINRVFLMGNVGQDPVVRHTTNGRAVCELSVATHRAVRNGDAWEESVEWTRVRLWEQKAELALRYITKGSAIAVEGSLRSETWTDNQGHKRGRTYVAVEQLHLLPGRSRDDERPEPRPVGEQPQADQIPF